ncbi:MAG: hypothetical protein EP341_06230 [Sphingomonadales bacterium]|nr:MAG: hypothetical protein EP341_06230 [Sphingomonadales bacterium]
MIKIYRQNPSIAKGALLGGVALFAIAGLPAAAHAQDIGGDAVEEDADALPVILVTARKQVETLQEVPVTITSVSGELLEKYGVDQVADVVSRVPTLNVQVGGSGSGGQLSLRGVGSSNISAAFDSAVAFDFDGIQVSTMRMVQAGFFDTQQIDVLKGPQSLYFGKSASAGVFSIRSANPTSTWEIGGKGSYEFEEDGYTVSGFISGPISDTLGIRVAAQFNDIDKHVELQEDTPASNGRYRTQKNFIARGTLAWDPFDNFSANLKVQYVRNENDGAINHSDIYCGANGVADPVVLLQGAVVIPAGYDCNAFDAKYFLPDTAPALAGGVPTRPATPSDAVGRNGVPFGKTDLWFSRLRWDLDLTDSLTLTSVSGYLKLDAVDFDNYSYGGVGPAFVLDLGEGPLAPTLAATNGPGVPLGVGTSDPINRLKQFSQEVRLASDFDGMVNFMLGAFYEDREFVFDTAQNGVNISIIAPDPTLPLLGGGVAQGTGFTYDWDKTHTTKTEAISLFGSVTLDLSEQLELSGGLRWTDETKIQTISVPYVHNLLAYVQDPDTMLFVPSPAFLQSGFFSGPIEFKDNNWSPEVTLKYQASDDVNVFASFKTGFKSGGIDNSALPSNSLSQAAASGDFSSLIFQSETSIGGEVGIKSQFNDRDVTLNVTAYYYVFDDLQVQNFDAIAVQFATLNAGEVTTQGIDVGWNWRTPVEGLQLSGNLSYLDAEFSDSFLTEQGEDLDGRAAARAPKFSGNLAFDFFTPIGNSLEFGLSGNATYSDSYFTDESTLDDFKQDSYVSLDAAVSIGDQDGKWKLSLIGNNLTDEIWVNTSGGRPFLPADGDDLVVTQNRGRQVYVEASFKF